jgi:hypothetical protein
MSSNRLATLCVALSLASFLNSGAQAQTTNAYDNGSGYSGGWTNGANGGTGFGPWSNNITQGGGFAGAFLGNPGAAGINTNTSTGGLPNPSFGLYANPNSSTAEVSANRSFSAGALVKGQTFSIKWAVNWDADGGNKGFNLYSGGPAGTQLFNVNQGGFPGDITINGTNTSIGYGTSAMTWKFTMVDSNSVQVTATPRDGSTNVVFTRIVSVPSAPDSFRLYATKMGAGDQRQPYFNEFLITTAPLDTDGDGTPDAEDPDIDGDGLANTVETNTGTFVDANDTGTNPLLADTDSDGYNDGAEVNGTSALGTATNPLKPNYATMAAPGNYAFSGSWENNGSNNTAMTKAGEFGWTLTRNMTNRGGFMLKFVANSNWGKQWGISGTPGAAQAGGEVINFQVTASGLHTFTFNNDTLAYAIVRAGTNGLTYDQWAGLYGFAAGSGTENPDFDNGNGDFLTNQQEFEANTDPLNKDTDGDGLFDDEEVLGSYAVHVFFNGNSLNPLSTDSDGDGLPDAWELVNGLDPTDDGTKNPYMDYTGLTSSGNPNGANGDPEGDGLTNAQEFAANSDPRALGSGFIRSSSSIHVTGAFTAPSWTATPATKALDMVVVGNFTWRGLVYWGDTNAPTDRNFKFVSDDTWDKQWGTNNATSVGFAVRKDQQTGGVTTDPGPLVATAISAKGYYVFELNEYTGAYSVAALAGADLDIDGLPDAWESFYGAQLSTPTNNLDPAADSNGDGQTNLVEFENGGNPVLDLVPPTLALATGVPILTWVAVGGEAPVIGASDVVASDDVSTGLTATVVIRKLTGASPGVVAFSSTENSQWRVDYSVQDGAGNTASVSRSILVGDVPPGWRALVRPPTMTISKLGSVDVFGQIYVESATPAAGAAPAIQAWVGVSSANTDPATWDPSAWTVATFSSQQFANDEYKGTISGAGLTPGTPYYYATRWQIGSGAYTYGGTKADGSGAGPWDGTTNVNGVLTVNAAEITFANVQFPTAASALVGDSVDLYVQFYASLITDSPGAPTLGQVRAQVGVSTTNSNPGTWASEAWVEATWNAQSANNDEYKGTLTGLAQGIYYTASRFSLDGGATWVYGGTNGVWNNDSGTITMNAVPTGSTFASWSGGATLNEANVGKYAIGGATSVSGSSEKPVIAVDSNTLSLSAIVRTNDGKLTVVGEAGGSLTNWSTNGVSVTASTNTNGVPEGHQRRVFSVDRTNSPTRQFLRLKATLDP